MKKVLIIPASAPGHVIPTFRIAKLFIDSGYEVHYLIEGNIKKLVEEQHFNYTICPTLLFHNHGYLNFLDNPNKTFFEDVANRLSNYTVKSALQNLIKFEQAIDSIAPDEILFDSFLTANYILMQHKRPTTFIQTMVSTYKGNTVPPLDSNRTNQNKLFIQLDWLRYKTTRQVQSFISMGENNWGLTKRCLKKLNRSFDVSLLNWDKCFQVGIKNVPEWVTSPIEFDFPREKPLLFQKHIGPTIDLNRKEIHDAQYTKWVEKTTGKKIAYCSLGTISLVHNKHSIEFLKKVVTVFSTKQDWELVISCGEVEVNQLGIVLPNIHLFKKVPQLDVLKRSDLVMTHGGLNTVMECILFAVPMLVFPLNNKWDQNGNAARVVYHKLGLSGEINTITLTELKKKIEDVAENLFYKENITNMSCLFHQKSKALNFDMLNIEKPEFTL